ncbi:neuronal PAS domain-containing protein 4-like isoform X2 [Stigmatopora argus]
MLCCLCTCFISSDGFLMASTCQFGATLTCKRHMDAPQVFHFAPLNDRSTKGASKARRDHINHEIRNMRALLPIPLEDQERLSYLHSMSAVCTYIRKSVLFQGIPNGEAPPCSFPYEAFLQALHGFILVTTVQGRLVYVSENVSEYLGFSMVDILQGDTIYDMVEPRDVGIIESILKKNCEKTPSSEISFICEMQTSKTFKQQHDSCSMLVQGSFNSIPEPFTFSSTRDAGEPLLWALCTPTVDRLSTAESHLFPSFDSVHALDMSFTQLSDSVSHFLGYSAEEMVGRSWYSLLHPEDLSLSVNHHKCLLQADENLQVKMVIRLQCKDLSWARTYVCAHKESECQTTHICCTNFIISETEAKFLQRRTTEDALRPSSPPDGVPRKKPRTLNNLSDETCSTAMLACEEDVHHGHSSPIPSGCSPSLFTPPYSPASSSSTGQQDDPNFALQIDVQRYTHPLLSSPDVSPSYYSYPEVSVACQPSPHRSLPSQHTFDQGVFTAFNPLSPASPSSPAYDFPSCASDTRLVPDGLAMSDLSESSGDCALHQDDFNLMEQPQEGSLYQVHHLPQSMFLHSLSMTSEQYNQMEQAEISILAEQISSLASTFDMFGPLNLLQSVAPNDSVPSSPPLCQWPNQVALPSAVNPKLTNDGLLESLLHDLDAGAKKSAAISNFSYDPDLLGHGLATPENSLAANNVALDPFTLQLGCQNHNTELHQLNHTLQSSLQQEGRAEENQY